MSIHIKGVEMPAMGVLCIDIFPDGRVAGHYDCTIEQAKAVPVPPHGRLIDADALDADLERKDMHTGEWDAVGFSIEEIENAPTVIEAEEGE